MKWEKLVTIIGLVVLFSIGVVIVIFVFISDMDNYLTPYDFLMGVIMMVLPGVFIRKILQKKRK